MEHPVLFATTVLGLLSTPGPSNSLLATAGASVGIRKAWSLIAAEVVAYLLTVLVLHFILGPVLAGSPKAAWLVKLGVTVYLLWLAFKIATSRDAPDTAPLTEWDVFITTMLNPKAIIFAFIIIPFDSPMSLGYVVAFGVSIILAGTAWVTCGAACGRVAKLTGRSRLIPRIGATAMVVFALLIQIASLQK